LVLLSNCLRSMLPRELREAALSTRAPRERLGRSSQRASDLDGHVFSHLNAHVSDSS